MELGERIKALRIEQSLSQTELGKRIGISEVSIRCWENGSKKPSMNAIISLANIFHVSTDCLLGVSGNKDRDNIILSKREDTLLANYRLLDAHGQEAVDAICAIEKSRVESETLKTIQQQSHPIIHMKTPNRYIPRFDTPSAAGSSAPLDGDDFEMILVDDSVPYDADFAVRIQGDSMQPYIHDGDIVYVKKDCDLSVGDIGIFCVDGAMYCKQYYIDKQGNLTLVSSNQMLKHTNVYVGADSSSSVKCYGKVLLGPRIDLPDYFIYETLP